LNKFPEATRSQVAEILNRYTREVQELANHAMGWEKMHPLQLALYKDVFNQAEVDGLIAFYEGPFGKALLEKIPLLAQKTNHLVTQLLTDITPDIQQHAEKAVDELKQIIDKP